MKGRSIGTPRAARPRASTDFFGHGAAIRASLVKRLPRRPVQALDAGTGFGRNALFLARHLVAGSHVWSVDPSEESLRRGIEAVQAAGLLPTVSLGPGSAEDLPFIDGYFHLAMAVMLFHHLVAVPPALREMARVTRRGGKLLFVDWAPTAHLLPFAIEHRYDDFFTPHAIAEMLQDLGLAPKVEHHPMWYLIEARRL
jgi:ubiquinone/menaquinone biosynthesis C-methylase UbiE